jgi:hypothetical protein
MHDIAAIMNVLLAEALKDEGYRNGMLRSTLNAQINDMQLLGSSGHTVWSKIHLGLSIPEARKTYREVRDLIEDAALDLGICLRLRGQETQASNTQRHRGVKRPRRDTDGASVLNKYVSSNDETDMEDGFRGLWKKRRLASSGNSSVMTRTRRKAGQLPTPTSGQSRKSTPEIDRRKRRADLSQGSTTRTTQNVDGSVNKARRPPRLLYRWHCTHSQGVNIPSRIRAGKFIDLTQDIPPPDWNVKAVMNHLIPETRPSPYISFRRTLKPCLHHAIIADPGSDACVTVIDTEKLRALFVQRWGNDHALQPCLALVRRFGLEGKFGKSGTYRGSTEWLVYGRKSHPPNASPLIVNRRGRTRSHR